MSGNPRALMPDYLRLIALFGIVVVNVQFIAFPSIVSLTDPPPLPTSDAISHWLVNGIATLKTYGLFSFMFGVGLGFQMQAAARRELPFGPVYRNRMIALIVLGLLHGTLFFPGDILVIYGLTGSLLYLWRDWHVKRLIRVGVSLLAVQVFVFGPIIIALPDDGGDVAALENAVMTGGSILEVIQFRAFQFAFTLPIFLIFQGVAAIGWFCLGLAAVKSGAIDSISHPIWKNARRWFLIPGVVGSLAGAAIWEWGNASVGFLTTLATAPLATVGYLGLIAAIARPPGPMMSRMLQAGGSSLSIYLGQSILLTFVFGPYGLGLWNATSRGAAVLIAICVTMFLIFAILIWRCWFKMGPFEMLLRWATYRNL